MAPPPPKRASREETLEVIAPYVHSVGDGGPFGSRVIALALHGAGVWWPFFFSRGGFVGLESLPARVFPFFFSLSVLFDTFITTPKQARGN